MIFSGADFSATIRLRLQFHFLRIRKQKGINRLIVDLSLDPTPRGPAPLTQIYESDRRVDIGRFGRMGEDPL